MAKKVDTSHARKEQQRTTDAKAELLRQLEERLGVVTLACKDAGVSRCQYYKWLKEDEEFRAKVDDIQEVALDFVENALFRNIQNRDTQSILYYLKTKGSKRGYGERQEIKIEMPQFNDNRTQAEVAGIFAERMKLYDESTE